MCVCVCVSVCLCMSVKRAAGDKELQRHSSANECKLLWQPRRVTPSVSSLLNQPHFLFSFSLLFSTLSVSMAIHPLPKSSLSLAVTPFPSLVCSLVFPVSPFSVTPTHDSVSSPAPRNQLPPLRRAGRRARNYTSICQHAILFPLSGTLRHVKSSFELTKL